MALWPELAAGIGASLGVLAWGAYHPASRLFGPVVSRAASDRDIALTFDDGPNPALTPRLLDLLDRYDARATFFVIGRWARACPSIVREIAARGHTIGNHTDTHPNLVWLSTRSIVDELTRCQTTLVEIAGVAPALMRPPFGARGPQLRRAVAGTGLHAVVTWTLMGRDWSPRGKRRLRDRLQRARSGDVVVLHDGSHAALGADREESLRALEYWLPRWSDQGRRSVALAV